MKHARLFVGIGLGLALLVGGGVSFARRAGAQGAVAPAPPRSQAALGSGFTYQGRLMRASTPVSGTCSLDFGLYDALNGGSQIGVTQTLPSVSVNDGYFSAELNGGGQFGAAAFDGAARYLQIEIDSCTGGGGAATLSPRVALNPAPYALYAQKTASYRNVLVVAQANGDYTSIQAALDSITDASDANRYLVWVAPGVYNEQVTMKPYVDIEGAGEAATRIASTGSAWHDDGTVTGASNAELRSLTVENIGGGASYAIAIYNGGASPRITQVTARASGGNANIGISNYDAAAPTLSRVASEASGGSNAYGIYNSAAAPFVSDATASATGGSVNNYGIYSTQASTLTLVSVTAVASGEPRSYGIYNSSSIATLTGVSASALGGNGSYSYGIYNYASTLTMTYGGVQSSGGTGSHGVYSENYSTLRMTGATVAVTGEGYNAGVYNDESSAVIQNCAIEVGDSATLSAGVANRTDAGFFTLKVDSSQITSVDTTIQYIGSGGGYNIYVGASLLSGNSVSLAAGGAITCAATYDENYTFYASSCP